MARSTARKRALNTLYEADEKGQDILSLLAERIDHPGAQTPLPDYAIDIVRGVAEHRKHIDRMIAESSTSWAVSRMPVVDRNIMRIAVWEIVYNDEIPTPVAIDEALAQAKTLCDAESPSFIHGLLTGVAEKNEARLAADAEFAASKESEQAEESEHSEESETADEQSGADSENTADGTENTEQANN
ncbi:transcription antitermination factor NusB [Bifidobacterium simiarum]|uniref:Transcription antitermination protein NusB n=1 Tax=Bifidobacterium simiarum TaxID=2045441 RepID=A0A2M9HGP5_9BIFI|nr:transcription antitermination factor NusB [Bifidobacterium simiarum]MBT1165892.1 transcription antitermination factor NusB [Bifidobacterium simiarum]PJM76000.1 transcription antitermination factor NusB [Bifidobacterium simiarum]